ncbi:MAG: hypothetical protein Q8P54_01565 [bacterium]|nr:hypothetical protein [bacterium]
MGGVDPYYGFDWEGEERRAHLHNPTDEPCCLYLLDEVKGNLEEAREGKHVRISAVWISAAIHKWSYELLGTSEEEMNKLIYLEGVESRA